LFPSFIATASIGELVLLADVHLNDIIPSSVLHDDRALSCAPANIDQSFK
jgi:hypothetical protein